MAGRPIHVLFACTLNRVRSPMAEAFARRIGAGVIAADSCGLGGAEAVDPFAAAVMAEVGIDLGERPTKTFEEVEDGTFDLIVSLTPEAHARAQTIAARRGAALEFWPIDDPTQEAGSREHRLEAYRAVRDAIARRIAERFGGPST